ncbi:MAG: hypothetical protein JSW25_05565 [Thermoplasmata archaeon]|nr:MAG: hypothetical protein JSW25_05565 [Thermoplasmata archaeon]
MPLRSFRPALGPLGLGLLLFVGVAIVSADTEPNDDLSDAEAIMAGTYVGSLNMTDRIDVYKLQVAGSDIIGISFETMTSGTQHLDVVDRTGGTMATMQSRGGVRSSLNIYVGCELDMEWWTLEVSVGPEGSEAPGEYELSLFYDMQDDGGTEGDAPCDIENAMMLDAGEHPGEYGFHDERDVYRVVVKAGWTLGLCLDCTDEAAPMRVQVYTDDDLTTPMKTMDVLNEQSCEWLLPAGTPLGTNWYIVLEGVSDDTHGEYTLKVEMAETDSGPPRITKVEPRKFDPAKDLKVRVTIDEDTVIDSATLHYRIDGKGTWKEVPLVLEGDVYTAKVGKSKLEGADSIEYYIVASDTTGFVGNLGSETETETMGSKGESPAFSLIVMLLAMVVTAAVLGRRRQG